MSFFVAAVSAFRIARENASAYDAAKAEFDRGASVTEIVHAFAAATDGELDDKAAELLDEGIRRGLALTGQAASVCARVAQVIDENGATAGRVIRVACNAVERHGPAVIERARSLAGRSDTAALKASIAAAAAGVLLVRIRTRIDALTTRR